ncbi:uncharacterized protein LOC143284752 [Babylonia areolata]|uniref:uncharacterized protein LOC143284752 n=1 Tax=Babylonia areolata TaxID=304850 RepID=UPI003FCF1153
MMMMMMMMMMATTMMMTGIQRMDRQGRRDRGRGMWEVPLLWTAGLMFLVGGFPGLVVASAGTGDHDMIPKELATVLTDMEKAAIASVDGDPDFIVGIRGMENHPLCFRLEGEPGHVVRLLQDPQSGVVVNARISRPVPDAARTYLSAVLIARRNFRVVAKVGRVLVNRYRFAWGPVSVRRIHGHRVLIAPTLLALTLRNMNVTLVVKRHLPEGRRPTNANDTDTSAPNTASSSALPPVFSPSPRHNRTNVVIAARATRRRASHRRRRPDDIDHGPRQRSRRHRRPPPDRQRSRRRKKNKKKVKEKGRKKSSLQAKVRNKREARIGLGGEFEDLLSRYHVEESVPGLFDKPAVQRMVYRSGLKSSKRRVSDAGGFLNDFENPHFGDSVMMSYHGYSRSVRSSGFSQSAMDSESFLRSRSGRSTLSDSRTLLSRAARSSGDDSRRSSRGRARSRDGSRNSQNRRSRRPQEGDDPGRTSRSDSRRSSRRNSRTSSSDVIRSRAPRGTTTTTPTPSGGAAAGRADEAGGNVSAAGGRPMRELAAYVGFYVADARDLSSRTHGLLGQFLHKAVSLQRVRQKANGVTKGWLLVEKPRPHHVKATLRTRTNMALNTSSTCWWLRDGGAGVVDGVYADYLVSRFRATDFLSLPPGLIGQ